MERKFGLSLTLIMKNIILATILTVCANARAQTNNPAPYCNSGYSSGSSYPELSNVEVGTWSNTSVHTPSPGYTYYNNVTALVLNTASTYTLKLTFKNVDMETMIKAWIDYNKDNVFSTNELIMSVAQGSVGTGMSVQKQAVFTVPLSAQSGSTRMRVSLGWHYANWGTSTFRLDSCNAPVAGDGSAGETEDYDVNISSTAGLPENISAVKINFFPNPAKDQIYFHNAGQSHIRLISVKDLSGSVLKQVTEFPFFIGDLNTGIYFLSVSFEDGSRAEAKVTKE